jgi:hypothetical protein
LLMFPESLKNNQEVGFEPAKNIYIYILVWTRHKTVAEYCESCRM